MAQSQEQTGFHAVKNQVGDFFHSIHRTDAYQSASGEFNRLKEVAYKDGGKNLSLKALTFAAGLAMVCSAVTGLLESIASFNLFNLVLDCWILGFGLIIVITDASESLCPPRRRQIIFEYAQFLNNFWGKGLFLIFNGTLLVAQWATLFDVLVGLYVLLVGAFFMYNGYKVSKDMKSMKSSLDGGTLKSKFDEYDINRDGTLDPSELAQLAGSLGTNLTRPELEAAVSLLDSNTDGRVSYDEFEAWFLGKNPNPVDMM
mmetsp:Transcript_11580/g.17118  ORF Transcript_11580/g.17118 Transcript_11580/m.17118 type:complete len:258 (-) Transcript_11580:230-1003(-)|eukprot:CAMPEP_0113944192 /NCGR_PEP_ID=MMETSP1339-20121228/31053_1 /TAXON_ID=94617 /ORGANISM="Fibrocapsa japonica" /LENGTH=257 /DNA_ID=CAMNT_0000949285 /DNA_START=103 /DNA_END=876 /DNA_ORIENTATION=+ /assembly_acc=CAM_ASM_000762